MRSDDQRFPEARRVATRRALVAAITDEADQRRRTRGRAATLLAVGGASLAIPVAAVAYYSFATVEDTAMIQCLTEASLDGDAIYLGGASAEADQTGRAPQIDDPVGACAEMWSQGVLRAGLPDAQPPSPGADLPVPQLQACVLGDGDDRVVAVVPGESGICAQLGTARWQR